MVTSSSSSMSAAPATSRRDAGGLGSVVRHSVVERVMLLLRVVSRGQPATTVRFALQGGAQGPLKIRQDQILYSTADK